MSKHSLLIVINNNNYYYIIIIIIIINNNYYLMAVLHGNASFVLETFNIVHQHCFHFPSSRDDQN